MLLSPTPLHQTTSLPERSMHDRYALVIVTLNPDMTDEAGNVFPEQGYIVSADYRQDNDIFNGLHGVLWGRTESKEYYNKSPSAKWAVVRTELNDEFFFIDKVENIVKFRNCKIVHLADGNDAFLSCKRYIEQRKTAPVCFSRQRLEIPIQNPHESFAEAVA